MAYFKSTIAVVIGAACLFLTQTGYGQSKPLKKIRVGVPSVGMGNIIISSPKKVSCSRSTGSTPKSSRSWGRGSDRKR